MSQPAACVGQMPLSVHNLHKFEKPRHLITIPKEPGEEAQLLIVTDVCVGCGLYVVGDPAP